MESWATRCSPMPPRAGSRSTAGTGGRSGASSLRSSSQPLGPATTSARTSPPPCRSALEASSSKTSSRPSRASSVDAEETDGWAMRARRSLRTRETVCIASSCQCQTSPGTDGTGALGHAASADSGTISPAIASPSYPLAGGTGSTSGPVHPDRSSPGARSRADSGWIARHTVGVEDLLRELSRVVFVDRTLSDILTDVTAIAARGIPGAESTSITLLRGEKAFTVAHFGEMSLAAEELQYEHGYGPCMDAGRAGVLLRVDDMHTEEGWPDYVAHVVATTPVRSSLSVPLPYQGSSIGALNIYSTTTSAFAQPESLRAG